MGALHRCNRVSGALLMRCWNASMALFTALSSHYRHAGALLHFDCAFTAEDLPLGPRESGLRSAGRMGEVGPPASGRPFFTDPYSHRGCSTDVLPCGAGGYRRSRGRHE